MAVFSYYLWFDVYRCFSVVLLSCKWCTVLLFDAVVFLCTLGDSETFCEMIGAVGEVL